MHKVLRLELEKIDTALKNGDTGPKNSLIDRISDYVGGRKALVFTENAGIPFSSENETFFFHRGRPIYYDRQLGGEFVGEETIRALRIILEKYPLALDERRVAYNLGLLLLLDWTTDALVTLDKIGLGKRLNTMEEAWDHGLGEDEKYSARRHHLVCPETLPKPLNTEMNYINHHRFAAAEILDSCPACDRAPTHFLIYDPFSYQAAVRKETSNTPIYPSDKQAVFPRDAFASKITCLVCGWNGRFNKGLGRS